MLRRYVVEVCRRQMTIFSKETIDKTFPPALVEEINEAESGVHDGEGMEAEIDIRKYHIVENMSMEYADMGSYS